MISAIPILKSNAPQYVREAIKEDESKEKPLPIITIIDVPSQAYIYKKELLVIFLYCPESVLSIVYDIKSFYTLGALHDLIRGINVDASTVDDTKEITNKLVDAISIARISPRNLRKKTPTDLKSSASNSNLLF